MNRRKFFSSFGAIAALPVAAVAKAVQDNPVALAEDGSKIINGNVRINGSVYIAPPTGSEYGLSVECRDLPRK